MKRVCVLTVTDIHQTKWMYQTLDEAIKLHQPDILALVGDFLFGGISRSNHYSEKECAARLAELPCEIVFVRGNHESDNWNPFVDRWLKSKRPLHNPHGDPVVFGPLVLIGFPSTFAHEEPFLMGRQNNTFEFETWLPNALKRYGPAARTLWLLHEPPAGTKLCDQDGPAAGVDEWRLAIEFYRPWLTVSGHDHETPIFNGDWHDTIDQTLCINAGQPARLTEKTRSLHYCVLEFEFAGSEPSLPQRITVTGYPWNKALVLPNGEITGI